MKNLAFKVTNELLNRGCIIDDVSPARVERVVKKLLPDWEFNNEVFVVCFGQGKDDWILARADEVGRYLSSDCTNFVYPIAKVVPRFSCRRV